MYLNTVKIHQKHNISKGYIILKMLKRLVLNVTTNVNVKILTCACLKIENGEGFIHSSMLAKSLARKIGRKKKTEKEKRVTGKYNS